MTEVSVTARFDVLGELLRDIAIGAGLRFRVIQVGDTLAFQVLPITDRSAEVRLDIANRHLVRQEVAIAAPDATRVIVAGQGEAELRTLLEASTTDAETAEDEWGRRIETFKDQRQTDDIDQLEAAGELDLTRAAASVNVAAIPTEETTMLLGADYNVGDIVCAVVEGQETYSTVTESTIIANHKGARVGFTLGDPLKFNASRALSASVDATASRVSALERTIASAPSSTNIADATAIGRALLTADSAASARSTIGAGTSNLALGSTSTTAAAGDHNHALSGLTGITIGDTEPTAPATGHVWIDTTTSTVVKVWDGASWG